MDNLVGKTLDGRYEIQEILGIGGMAVVYRAYDNIDDRPVAVKVLKEEFLQNEEFRRRFKNESKAIALMSHPNIVKVYDVSYGERMQYIVMEFVEGITLKDYIEQRTVLPWKEAVHFLTQILRALQHAHDRGIIHRDIKPQNIMLLHSGNIKVTDFGIARFARSETRTMSENAIGSVHYISPEQARGDVVDEKADIYSLGVVLYEMLTGEPPFQAESTVSVAIMQLQQEPRRPRDVNPSIPPALEQITIRAMQKNPADRYQSAAEMLLDLEQFKHNPNIRFEYTYYADQEPTRYVSPLERPSANVQTAVFARQQPPEDAPERAKILPLLIGIFIAVAAIAALIVFVSLLNSKNTERISVPDFMYMSQKQIQDDIQEYTNFSFTYETQVNPTFEQGKIFKQDPAAGTKAKRESDNLVHVTLYIAGSSSKTIPDVVGMPLNDAKAQLESAGFKVITATEYAPEETEGSIVRTDPEANAAAATGDTVTIYMATPEDLENLVKVPKLLTWSQEQAKKMLEQVGLVLDSNVEEVDSELEKGKVCWQSTDPEEKVPKGSKITIRVSNGSAPSKTASFMVQLPSRNTNGTLKVYIGSEKKREVSVFLDGSQYQVGVSGSGAGQKILVTLDDKTVFTADADFTKDPPALTNQKNYNNGNAVQMPGDGEARVPNFIGMREGDAQLAALNAGFPTLEVNYRGPGLFEARGVVVAQSVSASSIASLDTVITITVTQ
ncbi:MAG: Stk1 family PASTA domain-containing Ser/Thr kinase [Oscillospiraceae bacterium]|jgi:serine/threonine-protein kinase|nr:Stk1 family PASTA domain-containing Ser/Thr kinase [Oscillospiraceae bacterium]